MWRLAIAILPACFPAVDLALPASFMDGASALRIVTRSSDGERVLEMDPRGGIGVGDLDRLWVLAYACEAEIIDELRCLPRTERILTWQRGDEGLSPADVVDGFEHCDVCRMDPIEWVEETTLTSSPAEVRSAAWIGDGGVLVADGRLAEQYRYTAVTRDGTVDLSMTVPELILRGLWLSPTGVLWGVGGGRIYVGVDVDLDARTIDLSRASTFETGIDGRSARFAEIGPDVWIADDFGGVARVSSSRSTDVALPRSIELVGHASITRLGEDRVIATGVRPVVLEPARDEDPEMWAAIGYTIFGPSTSSVAVTMAERTIDVATMGARTFVAELSSIIYEIDGDVPVARARGLRSVDHFVAMDDRLLAVENLGGSAVQLFLEGDTPTTCDVPTPMRKRNSFLLVRGKEVALVERDRVSVSFFEAASTSRACTLSP